MGSIWKALCINKLELYSALSTLALNHFSSTDWTIDFRHGRWLVDIVIDISHFPILSFRVYRYEYWLSKEVRIFCPNLYLVINLDKDN